MRACELNVGDVAKASQVSNDVASYARKVGRNILYARGVIYRYPDDVPRDVARAILEFHRHGAVVPCGDHMRDKSTSAIVPRVTIRSALDDGWMRISPSGILALTDKGLGVPVHFVEDIYITVKVPRHLYDAVMRVINEGCDYESL